MADYTIPRWDRLEGGKRPKRRSITKGTPEYTSVEREVHLEVHLSNTMKELAELLLSKHKDYGPKNISLAPGGALNGLRVRIHDKSARINHLIDNNTVPNHESLEDSFKDMANYAIISLLVLRGQWDSE
jgi:hypothetical protein